MIIRPALLYAAPVWGGMISYASMQKLQTIQNRCLKMALNLPKSTRTIDLHEICKIDLISASVDKIATGFYKNLQIKSLQHLPEIKREQIPYKIKTILPQIKYLH